MSDSASPAKEKRPSRAALRSEKKLTVANTIAYPMQRKNEKCAWQLVTQESRTPPDELPFCLQTLRRAAREVQRPYTSWREDASEAERRYDRAYSNLIHYLRSAEKAFQEGDNIGCELWIKHGLDWVRFLRKEAKAGAK